MKKLQTVFILLLITTCNLFGMIKNENSVKVRMTLAQYKKLPNNIIKKEINPKKNHSVVVSIQLEDYYKLFPNRIHDYTYISPFVKEMENYIKENRSLLKQKKKKNNLKNELKNFFNGLFCKTCDVI